MPGRRGHHRGSHTYPGFRSKKQWRWAFATHQKFAHKWAHETPGGKKVRYRRLPTRVGRPTARTLRSKKGR
jgi:hypothetical protein